MKFKFAKGVVQKAFGLIFTKEKDFDFGLVFDNGFESSLYSNIHTFGMKYPIAILYLDKKKKIIKKIDRAMPNKFYTAGCKARYVVELPLEEGKKYPLGYSLRKMEE